MKRTTMDSLYATNKLAMSRSRRLQRADVDEESKFCNVAAVWKKKRFLLFLAGSSNVLLKRYQMSHLDALSLSM